MSATPMTNPEQPGDALAGKAQAHRAPAQRILDSGREIVQVLTQIPCGTESGWRIHPGEEVGFILAGTVQMIQGKPVHGADGRPAVRALRRALTVRGNARSCCDGQGHVAWSC